VWGGFPPVPPEPSGPAGLETDCCHPAVRTPLTSARTPAPPAAGSTYLVQCSPSAVSTALGSSRRRSTHTLPRAGVGTPVLGSSLEYPVPWAPSPRRGRRLSWISLPIAHAGRQGPVTPGGSTPRHLPSSGFGYPLDGLLPCWLGEGPSANAARLGFALQGLAPPDPRYPSRGLASPVVPKRPQAAACRDSRG